MREYKPAYDTKIETKTVIERQNTMHLTWIDWDNYPFEKDTPEPFTVEKKKEYLRTCEQCKAKEIEASKYMWPQKVYAVGMASCYPHWTPRPTVLLDGVFGLEWVDWVIIAWARESEMKTETAIEQLKHASKNPGTLPSIACMKAILKEIERLKNEIADGYCLAYNSLPDREMEDQEDDLCAQINRLTEYIKRRQGEIERLRAIV